MIHITYRTTANGDKPTSTTVKGTPLTNSELDANIKAIVDEVSTLAPKDSPALTGIPTAPTAAPGNDSTQIATTEYVDAAVAAIDLGPSSPVTSVAGKTGDVTLTKSDVGLSNVTNDAQLKIASNLSDLNSAETARTNLGLGTAAVVNVTTSAADTTAGSLLKVGDFGVGSVGADLLTADFNNPPNASGIFRITNNLYANAPIAQEGVLLNMQRSVGAGQCQIFSSDIVPGLWFRSRTLGSWSPWREIYHKGSILGTVSQSSGIPTGAIIERGSNANGEYVRFADGTQICTRQWVTGSLAITTAFGQLFRSSAQTWTFPASFISESLVMSFDAVGPEINVWATVAGTLNAVNIQFAILSGTSITQDNRVNAIAIGRWY